MQRGPLVSVGIPTFNRVALLRRAAESVLAQDYHNVELVISDNASTDGTQAWCEELARRDGRVHYIRQPVNRGASANFAEVFQHARSSLYMVLGDDDWLERSYVSQCAQALLAQPDLVVVCGIPRMFLDQQLLHEGRKVNLMQSSRAIRVVAYLWQVGENVPFHGLMRRGALGEVPPMPEVLAGDWLFVAWLAFLGKIRTLDDTAINKSVAGTTNSWAKVVRITSKPAFWAQIPYPIIVGTVFRDIAWASPVYAPAGRHGRVWLACLATATLVVKFSLWSAAVVAKWLWYRFTTRPFPPGA
jgi:glycosyltransferase involved in cell wall biosynthesis